METFDPSAATAKWLSLLSPDETARAVAYTRGTYWHLPADFIVTVLVAWIILRSGVLTRVRDRLQAIRPRPLLVSFVVSAVFLATAQILALPWATYSSWYHDTTFGLSNQSFAAWLAQALLGIFISSILVGLVMIGVFAIIRAARRTWWLWATGLTSLGIIGALISSPLFIEPLFNTYRTAPDGEVREAIVALAEETGTPADRIYVYDGSLQSNRYTANVSGAFGTARIAISDVMLAKGADLAEVRAVVGHEIAHYSLGHTLWLASFAAVIVGFALGSVQGTFLPVVKFLRPNGVTGLSDPAGVPVAAIIIAGIAFLSAPLSNGIGRAMEEEADKFSLEKAREPDGLAAALIKTAQYRAPSPNALEEFLFYSHPSIENRIRTAMEWKSAHENS